MSKKRGVLIWCLFGLATILLFVSSLTVWSKRQLLDDQAWANSSTQLLANDEVRGAIAQKLIAPAAAALAAGPPHRLAGTVRRKHRHFP
jgi:uncharacterized iron-regulated membrane protein